MKREMRRTIARTWCNDLQYCKFTLADAAISDVARCTLLR